MKNRLLLSATIAAGMLASVPAMAADYVAGSHDKSLTNVWGSCEHAPLGANARTGVGANGKIYVQVHNTGTVQVYDKDGKAKDIKIADKIWVSITADDAGHIISRSDVGGWAGPEGAGWYLSENAKLTVIDSKTDEIIKDVAMPGGPKCRFDALPHVQGDLLNGFCAIHAVHNGAGQIFTEFSYQDGEHINTSNIPVTIHEAFTGKPAGNQTLGQVQAFGDGTKLAVYANPFYAETSSLNGLGNGIALYELVDDAWEYTGKYFVTPNHSSIGGFMVFEVNGVEYIVYAAGEAEKGVPSGDGFAIAKVTYTDTPVSNPETDKAALVAVKYAALDAEDNMLYKPGANLQCFNVEPVEGEEGSVYIYTYNQGSVMSQWKFTAPEQSGITDVTGDMESVAVRGGKGEITVEGAAAEVYNAAGMLVAKGAGSIKCAAGLYIVKTGDKAQKVVVK